MTGNVIADAVNGAPTLTGKVLRTLLGAFLPKPSTRPLGAYTGVTAGTPATIVTASSSTWTVLPHTGVLDVSAATDGPTPYSFDQNVTGAMTAADGSNPRIDLICVTHDDQSENDGTSDSPEAVITYVAGTPGASPAVPATPARSFVLAQVNVPKLNNGAPAVVFVARSIVAAGGIMPVASSTQNPANPYLGQYVDDAVLGLRRWDGAAWQTLGIGGDTGWESSGLPGIGGGISNWVLRYSWRVKNGEMTLVLSCTRTNSTLTMGSAGQLTDTPFATISGDYAPKTSLLTSSYVSSACSGGALWNGTNFLIADGHPGATIAPGDIVKATFKYPIG